MNIPHNKGIFGNLVCNPEKVIQSICCSYTVTNRTDPADSHGKESCIPGIMVLKSPLKTPENQAIALSVSNHAVLTDLSIDPVMPFNS